MLPKKLGEVKGFAVLGLELIDRSGSSAAKAFGEKYTSKMTSSFKSQLEFLNPIADNEKSEKTVIKVREMMEKYIGNNWDNSVEILEWSGFFFGACQIHWSLILRLAESERDTQLNEYAEKRLEEFDSWISQCNLQIKQIAL